MLVREAESLRQNGTGCSISNKNSPVVFATRDREAPKETDAW